MTEYEAREAVRQALDLMTDCLPTLGMFQEATNGGRGMRRAEYRETWMHPWVVQRAARVMTRAMDDGDQSLRMLLVDTTIPLDRLARLANTILDAGKIVDQPFCAPRESSVTGTPTRYIAFLTDRELLRYTSIGKARWIAMHDQSERPLTATEALHLIRQDPQSVAHRSFRVFGSKIGLRELLLRPESNGQRWRLSPPMATNDKFAPVIKVYNDSIRSYFARLVDVVSVT